MGKNKTGKYFKYAIGEIILVVIGILIALSISNWNQKQIEKKQIRNIYARIIQDFNHTATEIERGLSGMLINSNLMNDIIIGDISRDSLLTNDVYFQKYYFSITGYPDIQINETGIRLLESKIELNYELNTELTEALTLLYSEHLFEYKIDEKEISNQFSRLREYFTDTGIELEYRLNKNKEMYVNLLFNDPTFKRYLFKYRRTHRAYLNRLNRFKTKGELLIDKIKKENDLE
tara:strand:- start:8863 stop:9561 length:699 start_codon:yes stop_codon:yes gene_type:complete